MIPGHEERRLSDTQVTVPPLTGYGPGGPVAHPRAATGRPPSCARLPEPAPVLDAVGMDEINKIFAVHRRASASTASTW